MSHTTIVEMIVHMDCPGCESKIKKALRKLHGLPPPLISIHGVDNVDIDMGMQKVTVTGWADQKKVLKTVRKTGRSAELWPFPYNPEYHGYTNYYNDQHRYNNSQSDPSNYNYLQNRYQYQSNSSTYDRYMSQPAAGVSSYNYYVHGYNGHDHGYYHEPPHSTILDEKARGMFSDENTNACSIM